MTNVLSKEGAINKAKAQGWVEKENYDGEESNWRTAEEFLAVGDNFAAVQRERNEKLSADVEATRRDNTTMRAQMKQIIEFQGEQKKRAVNNEINRLKAEKRQAVEEADVDTVDEIEKEIEALRKEETETVKAPEGPSQDFIDWKTKNEWYDVDLGMSIEADNLGTSYSASGRFNSEADVFAAVDKEMLRRYPAELGEKAPAEEENVNPNKRKPPAVSSPRKGSSSGEKGFDDVPAEDKKMFYAQQEIIGKDNFTEEQFMALYEFE